MLPCCLLDDGDDDDVEDVARCRMFIFNLNFLSKFLPRRPNRWGFFSADSPCHFELLRFNSRPFVGLVRASGTVKWDNVQECEIVCFANGARRHRIGSPLHRAGAEPSTMRRGYDGFRVSSGTEPRMRRSLSPELKTLSGTFQ